MTKKDKHSNETQGAEKMKRYIQLLLRNKAFLSRLKILDKNKTKKFSGVRYDKLTSEQKKEHDLIDKELSSIISKYELLRRRCKKLMEDKHFLEMMEIAELFHLDNDEINYALALLKKDDFALRYLGYDMDIDMCKVEDVYDTEMRPFNKADEIIHLNPVRKINRAAYQVAIFINSMSSKRDVLDYVEKKWPWIDQFLRPDPEQRALRIRKRKMNQDIVDFIWENRKYPVKVILQRLDGRFPGHGFVYYEISNIIRREYGYRYGYLT